MMSNFVLFLTTFISLFVGGCSAETSKNTAETTNAAGAVNSQAATASRGATIEIAAGSPADTVRVFYAKLRERKFREAIFMTNLRPAVEGLTDAELKEFQVDFERIASQIPAEVQINGEIVSGENATVTANLPGEDPDKAETQQIELRKEGDVWIILTVDPSAEARIKKEGKNYFYVLRVETHEDEARSMLDRIAKAEIAYAAQNGGKSADLKTLVGAGLLPDDVLTSESTGYNFKLDLGGDNSAYTASAVPADYGRSGKLSFILVSDGKTMPRINSKDNQGKPLVK